jgi:hypothetical protein
MDLASFLIASIVHIWIFKNISISIYIYMENYLYRFYKNIVSWLQYIFVLLNIE